MTRNIHLLLLLLITILATPAAGAVAIQYQPHIQDTLGSPITGWSMDTSGDLIAVTTATELYVYRYPGGLQWTQAIAGIEPGSISIMAAGDRLSLIRDNSGTLEILSSPIDTYSATVTPLPIQQNYEIDRITASIATWNDTAGNAMYINGSTIRAFDLYDVFPAGNWTAPGNISSARYRGGIFWASPGDGDISIYRPYENSVTERNGGLPPTHTGSGSKPMILDQSGSIAWIWGGETRPFPSQYYPLRINSDGTATYITALIQKPPTLPWSVSWSGSYTAFSEGPALNIWDTSSLLGTFSAGSTITDLIISPTGLYVHAISQDGNVYTFSRQESDTWYLAGTIAYTNTPSDLQTSIQGTRLGWISGTSLYTYRLDAQQTPIQASLLITENGIPIPGATISIETGGVGETGWTEIARPTADSTGRIIITMDPGTTYRLTYGSESHLLTARSSQTDYVWNIYIPPPSGNYYYQARWIGTEFIGVAFLDGRDRVTRVEVELLNQTGSVVATADNDSSTLEAGFWNLTDSVYQIKLRTYTGEAGDIPDLRNSQLLSQPGAFGVSALPVSADMMQFLIIMLLITIAGSFSYLAGPHGALAAAIAALGFWALGWVNLSPLLIGAAIVVSGIGVILRGARDI